ncbi:AAA family ATPase [Bdellovibrio sp. BCCA]|uniref:AAA family ATPase n=1 Tax=Bdellovibrio sp. BCCA TaxID=3136281 RepID=UPI0030F29074
MSAILKQSTAYDDDHLDLIAFLDSKIKGQSDAKTRAALALKLHIMNCLDEDYSKKKINTIIVGPTGSGKTEIAEALASYIGIPFVHVDCSRLSSAGFKGNSIEDAIKIATAHFEDIHELGRGVLFLDEIDKLCLSVGDVSANEKIQFELLRIIEGTIVPTEAGKLNTKNMMVIAAGSFQFVKDAEQESSGRTIGIQMVEAEKKVSGYQRDFLMNSGLKKELLGRLHNLIELTPLSIRDMFEIIKTRELKSLLDQFSFLNFDIRFSDDELMTISEDVIKLELGARGARSILYSRIIERLNSPTTPRDLVDHESQEDELLLNKFKLSNVANKKIEIKKGKVFIREGEKLKSIYLIARGQVAVFAKGAIHNYMNQGTCVGGKSAFSGVSSACSIKATEDTIVYEFNAEDIRNSLTYSEFCEMILQITCSKKNLSERIKKAAKNKKRKAA